MKLFKFPREPSLRQKWLNAVEKPESELLPSSAVCSKHFLTSDFLQPSNRRSKSEASSRRPKSRSHKLRPDAVPVVNLVVCRSCFTTEGMMCPIKDYATNNFSKPLYEFAYETLTGTSMNYTYPWFPSYVCVGCAFQLLRCVRIRAQSIRALSILKEIVHEHGCVTEDTVLAASKEHYSRSSELIHDLN